MLKLICFGFLGFLTLINAQEKVAETLYDSWQQSFASEEVLYEEKDGLQELKIFRNPLFGKVLVIDGVIQTTEADEFIYHEMMAHVPLFSHLHPKKVLIVGGGDGGLAREVLRHPRIERVLLVDIDPSVVAFSKEHLPHLSQGAFDDPRLQVVVADASEFVKNCKERFDVILCDSTDPFGPGRVLFTQEFYSFCNNLLNEEGVFVNQAGVPFLQPEELSYIYEGLRGSFEDVRFFLAPIPTYVGGFMAFGYASNSFKKELPSLDFLQKRFEDWEGMLRYYNPQVHQASFALPGYIKMLLAR